MRGTATGFTNRPARSAAAVRRADRASRRGIMIEISIVKLCCAVIAAMMAAATFGFMLASILANCKYREMQADLARRETNLSHL